MTWIEVSKPGMSTGGWVVALAVATVPAQAGCGGAGACNEVGCVSQHTVSVVGDDDPNAVAPGDYEVVLVLDGEVATCPVAVALDNDPSCFAEDGSVSSLARAYPVITESGTVIYADFGGEPTSLSVTVYRDQVEVATSTQSIGYFDHQPNGEDCPPTCRSAVLSAVTVPTTSS